MKRIILSIVCGAAVIARAETKVGIIGLDTSHAIAFTKIMNVTKDPAVAGFRVTHAYQWGSKDIASSTNRYPKYIAQMKEMGVEIVPTIDALIASADCICLETNDGREHLWQAEKVFASGKPCFIDKPLAHNLRDAVRIYDLGRRLGAKYFSASALRYGKAVQAARAGDLDTAQPIDASLKSNLLTELGNVSLQIGEAVHIDPATGKLKDPNGPAAKLWMPQYEPGWELKA